MNPSDVLAAWNSARGPDFQVRLSDVNWNIREQTLLDYKAKMIGGIPCLIAVPSGRGVALGLSPANRWLSLWGHITDPAGFVRELVKEAGPGKLFIGGDEFHFVSGVPLETSEDKLFVAELQRHGFDTYGEVHDFVGELRAPAIATYVREARLRADAEGWTLTPATDDLPAFLAREFPGRWTREYEFWRGREDTARAYWCELRKGGELLGFARMAERSRVPDLESGWNPGALRLPLERAWSTNDSCLGPIGVALSQRGQGAGRVLLGLVLETLLQNDARRVCVDWTNAVKYYYPLSLQRARTYWTAWKVISG